MCRTFALENNSIAKIWHIYMNTIAIVARTLSITIMIMVMSTTITIIR